MSQKTTSGLILFTILSLNIVSLAVADTNHPAAQPHSEMYGHKQWIEGKYKVTPGLNATDFIHFLQALKISDSMQTIWVQIEEFTFYKSDGKNFTFTMKTPEGVGTFEVLLDIGRQREDSFLDGRKFYISTFIKRLNQMILVTTFQSVSALCEMEFHAEGFKIDCMSMDKSFNRFCERLPPSK